jgi:hypothetical protein
MNINMPQTYPIDSSPISAVAYASKNKIQKQILLLVFLRMGIEPENLLFFYYFTANIQLLSQKEYSLFVSIFTFKDSTS